MSIVEINDFLTAAGVDLVLLAILWGRKDDGGEAASGPLSAPPERSRKGYRRLTETLPTLNVGVKERGERLAFTPDHTFVNNGSVVITVTVSLARPEGYGGRWGLCVML